MGDVVNLNRFRKQKAKEERAAKAAENRVVHGRTKAERTVDQQRQDRQEADMAGKKLGPADGED
ncbi:DUF4169 family protein [Nitrospirillum sp. BR 11163]|uniref:DUF4169 family protein n=1 Tax=Nitrospirillum sp. BR 11163 TaxID=3104323 RepID=UPI002AFFE524|nr:DUF4169 family protein [Nitrospirillum sp. BR 11163]MEA1676832.1 DUF4169 family protein [Nitrospirillum sp. BR 11163]